MIRLIRRIWKSMLRSKLVNAREPVRPIVVTDAERAAKLQQAREAITFRPVRGFIHERFHERSN